MKAFLICAVLCATVFAQQKSNECPKGQHVEGDCNRVCACVSDAETAAAQDKAGVFVEPWKTLVRDTVTVNAGQALQYNFTLEAGTKLTALFHVEGGIDDRVQVFLLDSANYQLYTAHRPFAKTPSTSALIQGIGKRNFQVTKDDVYYLLLDNGRAWLLPRKVTLHVDAILPHSTPESEQMQAGLQDLYSKLKTEFVFADFHTTVRHCGVVNAFSNPNITMCVELLEQLQPSNVASVTAFVFFHELGHTLMKEWGLPMWDNEDAADEFATALILMAKQKTIALDAAQWWASQGASERDAVAKIWMDDRHSLSPQRARNIIRWVNNANDIVPRWERVFVPNMQTPALQSMLREVSASDKEIVATELSRRETRR
jgi:hypothetical protein